MAETCWEGEVSRVVGRLPLFCLKLLLSPESCQLVCLKAWQVSVGKCADCSLWERGKIQKLN